jgi:SAM-dependent methyltransferase
MPEPDYREDLRTAYDADVERRDAMTPAPWRTEVVDAFLEQVTTGGSVLELGCGTGQLAAHVAATGRPVTAIDLSPANVARTRARGITAHEASFEALPFEDGAFHGAFAMNSLLHVPEHELPGAIIESRRVMRSGSPLLIVVWGGHRHEGPFEHEWLDPPRYFSLYTDEQLLALPWPGFHIESFTTRDDTEESDLHAQILTLVAT